ncbi:pleckstrin homology domain-containing family M member 2 isoform X2 [Anabrus simplex]|uniref:pleckstrin homology domain-containing family M member 2 isoform X2 n=1 Tax=Anabrus simplex TaxID=316456 RepID=UPI0035A33437
MDPQDDKNGLKHRILADIGKSIKLIQQYGVGNTVLGSDSWLAQTLCRQLDLALCHGLRDPQHSIWPLVRDLSHSDTIHVIRNLQHVNSPLDRGRAWLRYTLTEGSLPSYLECLGKDSATLRRHYSSQALLRDVARTQQLLTLLAGLEHVQFNISIVEAILPEVEDNRINDQLLNRDADLNKDVIVKSSVRRKLIGGSDSKNLNAEYTRIMKEKISKDMINSSDLEKQLILSQDYYIPNHKHHCEKVSLEQADIKKQRAAIEGCSLKEKGHRGSKKPHPSDNEDDCRVKKDEMNSRMTKSCMAFVEHRNVSDEFHNVEKSKVDDMLTDNMQADSERQDSNVMSLSTGSDGIVLRRQRKKKRSGPDAKVKRVSFHEDFISQHKEHADFSASFLPPNPVIKRDVIKGRYSWCAEGDAPFVEQRKNDKDTKSDVYLSSSTLTSSEEGGSDGGSTSVSSQDLKHGTKESSDLSVEKIYKSSQYDKVKKTHTKSTKTPPVTERGTPEGQEDPPKSSSTLQLNSITDGILSKFPSLASSIDWSSDTESDICEKFSSSVQGQTLIASLGKENTAPRPKNTTRRLSAFVPASKKPLLTRFMRSITEKKFVQRKLKLLKPSGQLYIRGAKPIPVACQQFYSELEADTDGWREQVSISCPLSLAAKEALRTQVFQGSTETIYKVFKVRSSYFVDGVSKPLLAVLTDSGLYLVGMQHGQTYQTQFKLQYNELDAIMVGPNSQTVLFISTDHDRQFMVASGDRSVTEQLVSHVEIAMRRSPLKPTLPAVGLLALDDMRALDRHLIQHNSVLKDENLQHYSLVHIQEDHLSPPTTPLGPTKEGHLMFRPATSSPLQPWEPGYFILKGGVVYMFGDHGHRLPKRVIPLHAGQCQGCRRMLQEPRPHTFEILLGHHRSFQFAAADEYEASDWLQALVQAASGLYESEQVDTVPCSLILTSNHIVMCQESFPSGDVKTLVCAAITDMTMFGFVAVPQQSWCVLEFTCREVHESSGDWVLYFDSTTEMMAFQHSTEQLWTRLTEEKFPLHNVTDHVLHQRCTETSHLLAAAWDELLLDCQQT